MPTARYMSLFLVVFAQTIAAAENTLTSIPILQAGKTQVPGVVDSLKRYGQFREPGLVLTNSGRLVLVAQARDHSAWPDRSGQDLVVRYSDDHGATWSQPIVAAEASDFSICPNAVVYDGHTDEIHCLYNVFLWNYKLGIKGRQKLLKAGQLPKECQQFHILSSDGGKSWSKPRQITSMLGNDVGAIAVFGSGRGIQLQHGDHKGRLCIPGGKRWHGWANVVYFSDDHGKTWQTGTSAPVSPAAKKMNVRNECKVAQLRDGALVLNCRSMPFRTTARSLDGGNSWSAIEPEKQLPMASCNASLISHVDKTGKASLVFSAPAGPGRLNGVVCVSEDGGHTWPHRRVLFPDQTFAYSSLCSLPDGSLGMAYEAEVYHGGSYKDIRFVRFQIDDIIGHQDKLPGGPDPNAGTYENK